MYDFDEIKTCRSGDCGSDYSGDGETELSY